MASTLALLAAATASNAAQLSHTFQVVFSAECNPLFDWHSVALYYSFQTSGFAKTANITRLLACSEKEQKDYPTQMKSIGPTFMHRNLRDDPLVDEVGYPSYNKPYSVMAWLEGTRPLDGMSPEERDADEFILMMDADMVFRDPIDPIALGAARGVVISAEYTYLVGTGTGFAERFIAKELVPKLAQVGGFHIFHREDLRLIAPRWLEYTKRVRAFAHSKPEIFFAESMAPLEAADEPMRAVRQKQSMWHSEMYGYVFAAAEVGVTHHVRRDVMLYPGYQPWLGRGPNILHYGSDYTVKHVPPGNGIAHEVYFNKMTHTQLRLENCPGVLMGAFEVSDWAGVSKRDALCIEHLAVIDAAFCHFYAKQAQCETHQIPPACVSIGEARLSEISRDAHQVFSRCDDEHDACASWAASGECERNKNFMHSSCAKSCKSCGKSLTELNLGEDAHLGDWKYFEQLRKANGTATHPIESHPSPAAVAAAALPPPPPPPPPPSPSPSPLPLPSPSPSPSPSPPVPMPLSSPPPPPSPGQHVGAEALPAAHKVAELPVAAEAAATATAHAAEKPKAAAPLPFVKRAEAHVKALGEKALGIAKEIKEKAALLACTDAETAVFCEAYVRDGGCKELSASLQKCRKSCGLCGHPDPPHHLPHLLHDRMDRVDGSRPNATRLLQGAAKAVRAARERAAEANGWHVQLLLGGAVAGIALLCCVCSRGKGQVRRKKLEDKCAV